MCTSLECLKNGEHKDDEEQTVVKTNCYDEIDKVKNRPQRPIHAHSFISFLHVDWNILTTQKKQPRCTYSNLTMIQLKMIKECIIILLYNQSKCVILSSVP